MSAFSKLDDEHNQELAFSLTLLNTFPGLSQTKYNKKVHLNGEFFNVHFCVFSVIFFPSKFCRLEKIISIYLSMY